MPICGVSRGYQEGCDRYKLTALPVPDIVISYLNGLYNKDYHAENVEYTRVSLLEFRLGQRVIDDQTDYGENYDPELVYELNLNKAMDEYARVNRGAENYDPMKKQVETFERVDLEGDYVIKKVDKQLEDLQLNRKVDETLLPEVGEETNEFNAEYIAHEEQHEDTGEANRDTHATINKLEQKQAEIER